MLFQIPCSEYEEQQYTGFTDECYYSEKEHTLTHQNLENQMIQTVYGETKPLRAFIKEVIERDKNGDLWEPGPRTISAYYKSHSKYLIGPKNDPSVYVHPVFFCKSDSSNVIYAVIVLLKKYM